MKKIILLFIFFFANYQAFTQTNCVDFYHIGDVNALEEDFANNIWLGTNSKTLKHLILLIFRMDFTF